MIVPELEDDPEWIELGQQYQVFRPEEGPLERRIGVSFEEALFLDENDEAYANQEHQNYWFTTPEGQQSNKCHVQCHVALLYPGMHLAVRLHAPANRTAIQPAISRKDARELRGLLPD